MIRKTPPKHYLSCYSLSDTIVFIIKQSKLYAYFIINARYDIIDNEYEVNALRLLNPEEIINKIVKVQGDEEDPIWKADTTIYDLILGAETNTSLTISDNDILAIADIYYNEGVKRAITDMMYTSTISFFTNDMINNNPKANFYSDCYIVVNEHYSVGAENITFMRHNILSNKEADKE